MKRIFAGSTNPKEGQPDIKNELDHWSDHNYQISKGKYSPAAKTLMDKTALAFGEEHPDIRVVIFNPSMILGERILSKLCLQTKTVAALKD